jgi:hypothetical protein
MDEQAAIPASAQIWQAVDLFVLADTSVSRLAASPGQ